MQAFVSNCRCNSKTIRNLIATLRMMWNSARAWGYVAHNPFDALVLPKRGLVRRFSRSLEEAQRIIVSASEPYKTYYSILAETGIRGGEVSGLRVADLDLENALIHVQQAVWRGQIQTVKSRKGNRCFAISAELVEDLRAYLRSWRPNPLGLLFATKTGAPWDHSLVRKRKFHPLLKRLGIPQCGFHAFRRACKRLPHRITLCGRVNSLPPRPLAAGLLQRRSL